MDSIATVSQDSSVFTVTPKTSTQAPEGGTGSITFRASDGVNIIPYVSSFTLNFISTVENSRYSTLLATATGTSDNNNITDSSTNNYTITVNGDAYAGTFSPYRSGGYSTYFDGAGDYLNVSSSSGGAAIGSGDFTISFWVYFTGSLGDGYLLDYRPLNTATGNHLVIYTQSDGTFRYKIAGTDVIVGNTAISTKQWAYFCVARDNGTTKMYVNGTLQTDTHSGTENLTNGSNRPVIGTGAYSIQPFFNGYISDLRVVTSLDTTAYSVPTERVSAVTNTSLLTCHLPYIADGSTNDHSITVNGDVSTKPFSPFDKDQYSVTDHGGSVYFVGGANYSSQYLSLSGPTMPSGDFTLSTWAYLTSNGSDTTLIDFNGNSGGFRIMYVSNSNGGYHFRFYTAGGTVYLYDQSVDHYLNQWYYIVVVRDSGTFKFYVNNVLIATSTANPTFSSSNNVRIGQMLSGFGTLEGYLSDIIYNPTTAITDFTPSTAPLSSTGAFLHIKGTDASIIDKSQRYNIDLGSTSIVGHSETKWSGENSIFINSNSNNADLITLPAGVLDASKPFTIEMWLKTLSGSTSGFWSIYTDSTNLMRLKMRSDDRLEFYHRSGSYEQEILDATNTYLLNNTDFYHVAVTRDANSVFYLHQNGIKLGNFTASANYNSSAAPFIIGKSQPATERYMQGYIQDFRITQGLARYTAADETSNIPSAPLEG
jgi:hypothetical protein